MSKDQDNDKTLWQQTTKDVVKLSHVELADRPKPSRIRVCPQRIFPEAIVLERSGLTLPQGGGIDRNTEDRIRRGQVQIDASLDLHGHTLNMARSKLLQFVAQSFSSNKRMLLVITGKGRTDRSISSNHEGAIKREFRLWLEDTSVKAYILSVSQAQPRHGGSGAYYIYLRKSSAAKK